jgi:hypothetical protein
VLLRLVPPLAGRRPDRPAGPVQRPLVCPNTTRTEVVGKIIYLRQHYHFGPLKISIHLKRYHAIQISHFGRVAHPQAPGPQPPGGLAVLQRHRRWKRYGKPLPGHQVQIEVKFVQPLADAKPNARRKYYQFTAVDDCTRLRVLRIYPQLNQKTAIQFLDYVLERLPFRVEVIQADNGAEFQSRFRWHVLDKGIGHVYIKAYI